MRGHTRLRSAVLEERSVEATQIPEPLRVAAGDALRVDRPRLGSAFEHVRHAEAVRPAVTEPGALGAVEVAPRAIAGQNRKDLGGEQVDLCIGLEDLFLGTLRDISAPFQLWCAAPASQPDDATSATFLSGSPT